jgi:hypothetical protein
MIRLACISAQLNNRISKGEMFPVQTILGVAVTTAIACGAIGARLAQEGRRGRAAMFGESGLPCVHKESKLKV